MQMCHLATLKFWREKLCLKVSGADTCFEAAVAAQFEEAFSNSDRTF
jgi:hypothetical protein